MQPFKMTLVAALAAICVAAGPSAAVSSEAEGAGCTGASVREMRVHSHNDYAQKRPFWGAYEAGADSIEADVFLEGGELLVAHSRKELKKENTLRRLYLEPLRTVFRKNDGRVRANGKPLQLVIDLKSGKPALDALLAMIEREGFRECFDIAKNPAAARLSVGGDISEIKDFLSYPDYVFFSVPSSRKMDDGQYRRVSWISDYARIYTKWRSGAMAEDDKKKIRDAAAQAHAKGVPYRLWGFPDHAEAWRLSRELGLDYLNTDHPDAVAAFLASSPCAPTLKVVSVAQEKPLRYEKRNGRLEVRSLITLSAAPEGAVSFALDGKPLVCEAGPAPKTICAWLPFVGGESRLDVIQGGRVASFRTAAPIDGDWGYFANGEICMIQSSHQDIAWMDTPDYCRKDRIEKIIKPALEMMDKDPAFMFEMEQTLNLMEFLEACPERKDEVVRRYREGRFFWGATFNQPYEGLASGEQLARQAYFGRKWVKDNLPGCDEHTAVNMDVPGRASQMPQILAKSGIGNLFISRFGEGYYRWNSPDGSGVFTYSPGNYGWATLRWKFFDGDVVSAFRKMRARLRLWDEYYRRRGLPPRYAVVISCDATRPISYSAIFDEWNAIAKASGLPLPRVRYACSDTFLSEMSAAKPRLDEVCGERPNLWLYIHGPAHYEQTLDKRRAAISLPAAEGISALNAIVRGKPYPYDALSRGWMASIYPDHGLGGKNGDITDRIFGEYLAEARKIGDETLDAGLEALASDISGKAGDIVLFNTFAQPRTAIATVSSQDASVQVLDAAGTAVPCQRSGQDVHFLASVSGFGYARYRVVPSGGDAASVVPSAECGDNFCSNRYYDVTFGPGGITRLFDRELGRDVVQNEKYAFGDIYEVAYSGNGAGEFVRIRDVDGASGTSLAAYGENWRLKESGPLFAVFENDVKTKYATIVQRVTVHHAVKKIDFDVELRNFTGQHNRQYRIMFPLAMERGESDVRYESPAAVSRVGHDEIKRIPMGWASGGSYVHHPADSHPREIQNYITANGGGIGCTMSSCVAVADWIDPAREVASYVVLQGVLLSSHKSCHGKGNWYAQKGTHKYHFSVATHEEGWKNGHLHGAGENHAFRAVRKKSDGGALPPSQSLLAVSDPFTSVMAFKLADDRSGAAILRLVEMEGIDKTVTVKLPFKVSRAVKCNIIEEEQGGPVEVHGDTLTLRIGHHAIETVKLVPAKD